MAKKTLCGTALVTGGAVRIGRAICERLAQSGYKVAIHYRDSRAAAESLKKKISKSGGTAEIFRCDLGKPAQAEKLIARVVKVFPDLSVLINNASVFEPSALKTFRLESFDRHMDTNLKAPMILTRDFARICKKGHIINILDTHITINRTAHTTYLLSKKSLADLTKISALELSPNIRVNAVAPGLILAPIRKQQGYLERMAKNVPARRTGNPENITQSITFLLENTYVNGQIIYNDGGEHLI